MNEQEEIVRLRTGKYEYFMAVIIVWISLIHIQKSFGNQILDELVKMCKNKYISPKIGTLRDLGMISYFKERPSKPVKTIVLALTEGSGSNIRIVNPFSEGGRKDETIS